MKIKVLEIVTGLGMGGAEKVVFDLSKNLDTNNFKTFVIGMSKRNDLFSEFIENKIDTTILNRNNSLVDFYHIIKETNKFIKKHGIQVVHAHLAHAMIIASIIKILNPSLKLVFTSHSLNIGSKLLEVLIYLLKPLRNIDIIFSKDILKFFYKSNYKIIPNGVEIEKYNINLQKNNKFTFIAIGRLENVKNHIFLIELVNELKGEYDFELQIVGEGYLREDLEKTIKQYHLEDKVKLLGMRYDIPLLLNKSHCLLMSSLWEGLPMVILEAGASKLPIISTPVGSIPSILNINNSYIVEPQNFKNAMIEVINNYNEAKKKGELLFEKINTSYSINSITKKHEKIYKELI